MIQSIKARLAPILGALAFLLTGLALIPYPGLQNDELFFAGPIFDPGDSHYSISIAGFRIPLMVMSYSGALKTWLYAGLFQFFEANPWTVRLPALLMGIGTIWLTWTWVRRLAGDRAAAVTVALLATDTMFQITNTFDWGPVALQHLLLMGGVVAAHRWLNNNSTRDLVLAAGLWGLGLWDKALLIWPLIGLATASFVLYPAEVRSRLRGRTLAIALSSFLLAAAPLIWYNVARPGETATQNARLTLAELRPKVAALSQTIKATALYNYMTAPDSAGHLRQPDSALEKLSVAVSHLPGDRGHSRMLPAWLLGFALTFLLRGSPYFRLLLFLMLATAVTWLQMALTRGAGGSAHHAILLWPLPLVWLGIVFSEAANRLPRRSALALWGVVGILSAQNLLTTNQYLARFIVNGPGGGWTDALDNLATELDHKYANWYGLIDWGYLNGLRALHDGDLSLFMAVVPPASNELSEADRREMAREMAMPDVVFIRHTDDKQIFPGTNQRFRKAAAELGYTEIVERRIPDGNGRPVFELFRLHKEGT